MWKTWAELIQNLSASAYLQALSLPVSMLVAWVTTRFATSNQRETIVAQEVCRLINEVGDTARKLRSYYEQHYRGSHEGGFNVSSVRGSQRQIQALTRELEMKREIAGTYLPRKMVAALRTAQDRWLATIEADEFPIYRKADIFKEDHPHFEVIHKAHCDFETVLATLRKQCLRSFVL